MLNLSGVNPHTIDRHMATSNTVKTTTILLSMANQKLQIPTLTSIFKLVCAEIPQRESFESGTLNGGVRS
jgi:hypothetical protein